jgi:hypothetical protein
MKLDIWFFQENLSIKYKFHSNPTRIRGTICEYRFTFMTMSRWFRWFRLRIRNFSDKNFRANQNTHFMFYNFFVPKIAPFKRKCGKILLSWTGHWWQYYFIMHNSSKFLDDDLYPVLFHHHAAYLPTGTRSVLKRISRQYDMVLPLYLYCLYSNKSRRISVLGHT